MPFSYSHIVIFGGTGFVGLHLAEYFLDCCPNCKIVLADLKPPRRRKYWPKVAKELKGNRVSFVRCDVRAPIDIEMLPSADLVVNLAAIHREPGHQKSEYYETNIAGARNVTAYANVVGCRSIVFSSSIAVYGASEGRVSETSTPTPTTAYGASKLVAEEIHRSWVAEDVSRRLLVLRPGVIYGPGEGGNVSRLIKSVVRGYFAYTGNQRTEKSGGYIRELCHATEFCLDWQQRNTQPYLLANFSLYPPPKFADYVAAIESVTGKRRFRLNLPTPALLAASLVISTAARILKIDQPINPTRIRKLARSNRVEAITLQELGYENTWPDLTSAFADWKQLNPSDFE